jgi:hypothetical protein
MERYKLLSDNVALDKFSAKHLGAKAENIKAIATSFKGFTTEQSENSCYSICMLE